MNLDSTSQILVPVGSTLPGIEMLAGIVPFIITTVVIMQRVLAYYRVIPGLYWPIQICVGLSASLAYSQFFAPALGWPNVNSFAEAILHGLYIPLVWHGILNFRKV